MNSSKALAGALLFLLGACDATPAGNESAPAAENAGTASVESPSAAPAPNGGEAKEKVLRSETVEAVFTGWEVGDYVWANLAVKGRESAGAWVGPSPLEHFLEAHKGKPITVRLDTVMADIPEAGGEMEVVKVAEARVGTLSAAAWWGGLSAEQRAAAERKMEAVLSGG